MNRLFAILLIAAVVWMCVPMPQPTYAGTQPGSGIDSTRTIGSLSSVELFRWIFQKNPAAVESLVVYVREHQGDVTVNDTAAVAEILSSATERILSLQQKHLELHATTPPGVF